MEDVLVLPLDILPPPDGVQGLGENKEPTRESPEPDLLNVDSTLPVLINKHCPNNCNESFIATSPAFRSLISWCGQTVRSFAHLLISSS
jgi:hypothetical protein